MRFPADDFDNEFESAMILITEAMAREKNLPKPTLIHCMRVALYLYVRGHNRETCIAALLHDAIEDTTVTAEQIERQFGERVTQLVQANTKDEGIADHHEKYMAMMQRCVDTGEEAAIIKAADIIDNLHYCRKARKEKSESRMKEAADILLGKLPATFKDPVFGELRTCLAA